ncbi:MAG: hypothetical protein R2939_15210 [Kofleriaceae bacterium]
MCPASRPRGADLARLAAVVLAAGAALASTTSNPPPARPVGPAAPAPQAMELPRTLGLWKSNFGAVKIEEDLGRGGPQSGFLQGVWLYERDGAEVIGTFAGTLRGNLLEFSWQEPATPQPLAGAGYLSFDPSGQSFAGRWWTSARDRGGEWTGWRAPAPVGDAWGADAMGGVGYGGATYGGDAPY